eukprot:s439_g2.t1
MQKRVDQSEIHWPFANGELCEWFLQIESVRVGEPPGWLLFSGNCDQVFKSMQRFNVQPNQITYTALLRARLEAGDLAAAERLESHLNLVGYTLLIDAYARLGKCVRAEETFEALTQRGLTPNLATYTALMKAYAKAQHPDKAEEVLDRLKAEGLEPNALSYLTLINAHSKEGDLRRAEELYSEQGPSLASATAMISAYGRAKDAAKAQEVFDQLRAQSIRPDAVCVRQLLQAFPRGYLLRVLLLHKTKYVPLAWCSD